ncbi:hypothetical protein [uncultured Kordia sp.]|uniref:hypothetical protein n=1 Tax=uncultured Kordia sp. TaxID=507699 RepID=UPI002633E9F5|nr:hypothetical protein [uncultured Kordia sp.]
MKTSIIEKHTFFETSILKVGLISELLRSKSSRFFAEIERWLSENEQVLKQFGYAESSRISILRNQLFIAKEKDIPQKRKHQFMVSAECLATAHTVLVSLHDPINSKISQARETIQQVLVLVKDQPDYQQRDQDNFNKYIKIIWAKLKADPQFSSVALQLQTLVPEVDIFRIIAEEVTL